ncbi:MAG: DUF1016 family protein [Deltaproteobacteria bacterium]|nr:MAG: DUF1016 family protein [Deltaproteobacteria bacterium]
MTNQSNHELTFYTTLLSDIKQRIQQGQMRAALSANAEMLMTYWDIGHMLHQRQQEEGWGTGVIPRLAKDLQNEIPEVKGFSERNLGRMIRFFREYPTLNTILPQPVAQLSLVEKSQAEREVATHDFQIGSFFRRLKHR